MAGNYPDVPSWRMAYDRDGTQVYQWNGNPPTSLNKQLSTTEMRTLNADAHATYASSYSGYDTTLIWIFPELRDLDAHYPGGYSRGALTMEVSTNTTNGVDGTWTAMTTTWNGSTNPTSWRTAIQSSTALGIRSVRFRFSNWGGSDWWAIYKFHLFGEPAPGENPHRLEIWHPTLDQRVAPAYFDWGNVPRGTTADKTFRVKNISPNKTAGAVRVAMEAISDTTPSMVAQNTLSLDGASWLSQVNVGDIGPGQISQTITIRRSILATATLGLNWFRVFAESSSAWF